MFTTTKLRPWDVMESKTLEDELPNNTTERSNSSSIQDIHYEDRNPRVSPVRTFSISTVRKHQAPDDLWMIIYNKIYDVTKFSKDHPGGVEVLYDCGGVDATEAFEDVAHSDDAVNMLGPYYVGDIIESELKSYPKLRIPVSLQEKKDIVSTNREFKQRKSPLKWKTRRRKKKIKRMMESLTFYSLVVFALLAIALCVGLQKFKWAQLISSA